MTATVDYTVAYERDGNVVDLCKIIFGGDGSYYVTAPYHPHDRALLSRLTVNYAAGDPFFSLTDALDLAVLDDDQRRLKLSHHPDGFLQFSGEGVTSGRDATGRAKGIGTRSWPLHNPAMGPAFGMSFSNPLELGRLSAGKPRTLVFREVDIEHMRPANDTTGGLGVTGFYFPVPWRQYVRRVDDEEYQLQLVNPSAQAILPLRVALASKTCGYPGFIGIQVEPRGVSYAGDGAGFMLSSATGDLRRNDEGELLGDALVCMYPAVDLEEMHMPSLNFPLPAPAYKAPPGTKEI